MSTPGGITTGTGWALWNGRLYYSQGLNSHVIYSSQDGINWIVDFTSAGFVPDTGHGMGGYIGGYGSTLYSVVIDRTTGPNHRAYFYRRDTAGNWTQTASYSPGPNMPAAPTDIVYFGGYLYCNCLNLAGTFYRSTDEGASWTADPDMPFTVAGSPTVHADRLYFVGNTGGADWGIVSRDEINAWRDELSHATDFIYSPVNVGGDGQLYANFYHAAGGASYLTIYRRQGLGQWTPLAAVNVGAAIGDSGCSIKTAAGRWFLGYRAAAGTMRYYLYAMSYHVRPPTRGSGREGGYPQALDVDGDGEYLYLAAYDNADQPILVRVELPLTAASIGQRTFAPGAGDAIGVKAGNVGGQLVVSGSFGNNEQVQISSDFGASFTDVDPGTWGVERAQPLLIDPNDLDEILTMLQTAQDIVWTADGGGTWTVINAAVGYSPGAAAKLPEGIELVVGDDAANRIDYSPNRGQQLTNITGVFAGNCQALEVA